MLDSIIGQEKAKKKLNFYLKSFQNDHPVDNILFIAEKGHGKTTVAKAFAKELESINPAKQVEVISCPIIRNTGELFFTLADHIGSARTFIFDEASEIPKACQFMLLDILNPTESYRNIYNFEGQDYIFNLREHTFLFATTDPQKVNHALIDRLEVISLSKYTNLQLKDILKNLTKDIQIADDILSDMVDHIKGSPRELVRLKGTIEKSSVNGQLLKEHWEDIKDIHDYSMFGLNNTEKLILSTLLENKKPMKLTSLACKVGETLDSVRKFYEKTLLKKGLITIESSQRALTQNGKKYAENYCK